MGSSYQTPKDRDRSVRLARRVRAGVVAVGILGTMGFAGLAVSNSAHGVPTAAAATGSQLPSNAGQTASAHAGHAPPVLQPGLGGGSHATTSGSAHVPAGPGQSASSPSVQHGLAAGSSAISSGSGPSHASMRGS